MNKNQRFATALDERRRLTTLGLVCVAGLLSTGKLARAAGKPATHTVIIKATSYAPLELTVKRGDTVTWVNQDPFPHTVTATGGAFDSKSIDAGASWKYKAGKIGEYAYTCTFHPNMKGMLKVE